MVAIHSESSECYKFRDEKLLIVIIIYLPVNYRDFSVASFYTPPHDDEVKNS